MNSQEYVHQLIAQITGSIAMCPDQVRLEAPSERDVPGHYLVAQFGRLICATGEKNEYVLQSLADALRAKVSEPHRLFESTYAQITQELVTFCNQQLLGNLRYAAAEASEMPVVLEEVFLVRLEAGYMLQGLRHLWPKESELLIMRCLDNCKLREFDKQIERNLAHLKSYAKVARMLIAEDKTRLPENDFHPMLELARC